MSLTPADIDRIEAEGVMPHERAELCRLARLALEAGEVLRPFADVAVGASIDDPRSALSSDYAVAVKFGDCEKAATYLARVEGGDEQ